MATPSLFLKIKFLPNKIKKRVFAIEWECIDQNAGCTKGNLLCKIDNWKEHWQRFPFQPPMKIREINMLIVKSKNKSQGKIKDNIKGKDILLLISHNFSTSKQS